MGTHLKWEFKSATQEYWCYENGVATKKVPLNDWAGYKRRLLADVEGEGRRSEATGQPPSAASEG